MTKVIGLKRGNLSPEQIARLTRASLVTGFYLRWDAQCWDSGDEALAARYKQESLALKSTLGIDEAKFQRLRQKSEYLLEEAGWPKPAQIKPRAEQWTNEQVLKMDKCWNSGGEEADALELELRADFGFANYDALLEVVDDLVGAIEKQPKSDAPNPTGEAKPASTAARVVAAKRGRTIKREAWRILKNYPNYEISSKWRVRALDRMKPDDFLTPRVQWTMGRASLAVALYNAEGERCVRFLDMLMIQAGFLKKPKWMK